MTWDAKKGAFMMHLIMAEDKCQALHFGRIAERFMQDKVSHEVLSSRELYSTGKKGVTWEKGGKVTSHDHQSRGKPIYKSRNKYREDQCSSVKPKRGYTVSMTEHHDAERSTHEVQSHRSRKPVYHHQTRNHVKGWPSSSNKCQCEFKQQFETLPGDDSIYPEIDAWDDQMYHIYEDSTRSQAMEKVMAKNLDARDKEASEISRAASSKHMKSRRKPLSSSTKMMDGVQVTTHNYNVEARPHVHEFHIYAARTAGTDDGTNKWGACTTMERALTAMYDEEEDDHNAMESPDVQYYDADQYEEDNDLPKLDVQPETPDRTPDQFTTSEEDTDYDNIEDFKRKDYERNDAVLEGIKAGNETSKLKMYS